MTEPAELSNIRIVDFDRSAGKDLVKLLEEKLEQAKRGELASFAYVAEHTDGGVQHDYVIGDGASVYKLLGIACALKDWLSQQVRSL